MRQIQNPTFGRDDTKVIKGVAILLMLLHHLWAFPERVFLTDGFSDTFLIIGEYWYSYMGRFGKICVSIYLFLSGYGLMKSKQSGRFDLTGKVKGLYLSYWKVFIVFIPIAFLFFANQPAYCEVADIYSKYSTYSKKETLLNFLGLSSSYNPEWYFFRTYLVALFTFPLISQWMEGHSVATNLAGIVVWSILEATVFPAVGKLEVLGLPEHNLLFNRFFCQSMPYTTCFWMGILMAKEDLLSKTQQRLRDNHLLNPIFGIFILLCVVFLRNNWYGDILDFLFVPAMILSLLNILEYTPPIRKLLLLLGKQSTNMWYTHSFFCYYFYPFTRIVVYSRNALVSLITLCAMSYASGCLLDWLWSKARLLKNIKRKASCQ